MIHLNSENNSKISIEKKYLNTSVVQPLEKCDLIIFICPLQIYYPDVDSFLPEYSHKIPQIHLSLTNAYIPR